MPDIRTDPRRPTSVLRQLALRPNQHSPLHLRPRTGQRLGQRNARHHEHREWNFLQNRRRKTDDRRQISEPSSDVRPPSSGTDLRTPSPDRITIFLATWSAESKKPLLMLGHTPDICWTGAGWKPIDLSQPREVLIDLPTTEGRIQKSEIGDQNRHPSSDLGPLPSALRPPSSRPLPFSCRAFEAPDRNKRELAVWCMLIDGQPLAEARTSERESVQAVAPDAQVRMSILNRLARATRQRLPVRGEKQFVR